METVLIKAHIYDATFVRDGIVHYGRAVESERGTRIWFLCERKRFMRTLYGGSGSDRLPIYEPGVETFHVARDVDCMTCLIVEARKRQKHMKTVLQIGGS